MRIYDRFTGEENPEFSELNLSIAIVFMTHYINSKSTT